MFRFKPATLLVILAGTVLAGCNLAPPETNLEVERAQEVGRRYPLPREKRTLPELGESPTWRQVLQRSFYANGEVEAAYWEWRAAIERVHMAGAYPNSNVQIGFDYMFSGGMMKAWDRTTISGSFDPTMTLKLPLKVQQAARVALADAQAAGARFENAKFTVQRRVLTEYVNYAQTGEKRRIQADNAALMEMLVTQASDRVKTGAPQQDLLKAQMQYRLAQNELATMGSELARMRAVLNGMLARGAEEPLPVPPRVPEARPVRATDAELVGAAVAKNPELAGLAAEVRGRKDALKLAKLAYVPDISPTVSMTGSAAQAIGAMVMLPTAIPMIEGQIKETQAMLAASEAMAQQTRADRAAGFVAALAAMRNAERAREVLEGNVLPLAKQVMTSSREAYSAGQISFVELIDSQRALLDVRQAIVDVQAERERRLAELEALAGVDVETLGAKAFQSPPTPATEGK